MIRQVADQFADTPLSADTVYRLKGLLYPSAVARREPPSRNHLGELSPRRSARRMPSFKKIVEYWWPDVDGITCVRCGYRRPLYRAHIIDRAGDGLDVPWNIAPLCGACHGGQPAFSSGDEDEAPAWFNLPPLPNLPGTC